MIARTQRLHLSIATDAPPSPEVDVIDTLMTLTGQPRPRIERAIVEEAAMIIERQTTGATKLLKEAYDALGEDLPPRQFNRLMRAIERHLGTETY